MFFTRRCLHLFGGSIAKKLEHYSQFQPSSLTIQQYLDFGRNGTAKSSYLFLRNELLVRLANIMQVMSPLVTFLLRASQEINLLPPKLLRMPSAKLVSDWYRQSFEDLLRFESADDSLTTIAQYVPACFNVTDRWRIKVQ